MFVSGAPGGGSSGWSSIVAGPPAEGPGQGVPNTTHNDTLPGSIPVATASPRNVAVTPEANRQITPWVTPGGRNQAQP